MKAQPGNHDDGLIGLGLLAMMTIALIAGQFHDSLESAARFTTNADAPLFSEQQTTGARNGLEGAVRELRIVPYLINSAADFGWSSDEELLDGYRRAGL